MPTIQDSLQRLIYPSMNFTLITFQIIVYCREREDQKFYFPCNQWLAKDEGDGQIVRQLTATTDSSAAFQGMFKLIADEKTTNFLQRSSQEQVSRMKAASTLWITLRLLN